MKSRFTNCNKPEIICCVDGFCPTPAPKIADKNKIMKDQTQLHLSLDGIKTSANPRRESARVSRAQWWFAQMRQVVDRAMDWEPNAPGRPEQTWFVEANGSSRN